jgi:hypothetical protein
MYACYQISSQLVFSRLNKLSKTNVNIQIEKICGLIYEISQRLLKEYSNNPEILGIPGFKAIGPFIDKPVINEDEVYKENKEEFELIFHYFKQSADEFRVIEKQEFRDPMSCEEISELIKYMMKLRYNVGSFFETYSFHEKMVIKMIEQRRKEESIENSKIKYNHIPKLEVLKKNVAGKKLQAPGAVELVIDEETHLFIQEYLKKFLKEKNNNTLAALIKARVM